MSRADVEALTAGGRLSATTDFTQLAGLDSVDICVPTPLRKTKDPDLSHIVAAGGEVARQLHAGQLVVLESTTYPGTVEEVVRPMLEEGGLRGGEDFFLAFSPERIDPGNREWTTANIPKAPSRESFMTLSFFAFVSPPPKPSATSASPSSCRAPVTSAETASATKAQASG